jgi:ribose transport system ATP-binding protein
VADPLSAPRFEMRGVRKAFGATVALDAVDFSVRGGEVCALVGQNGAGKSTLMAILAGALPPDAGVMRLDGALYAPRNPLAARQAGVAMIYQELSLAPHLSVMENIVLGVEPVRGGAAAPIGFVLRQRMRETAIAALAELGHRDIAPERAVGDLTPAAQQLVEIARALAIGCRVLVLDEPTSSLGHADVQSLFELIERLKAQGIAIVYISHFIEEVKAVSNRFVVLRDGRNAGDGVTDGTSAEAIVSLMVGRTLDELYPHGTRAAGEPILELDGLVPGAATLTLRRGEILGIAGLLGAGRTRLLRAIFGLEPVTDGRVRVGAYSGASRSVSDKPEHAPGRPAPPAKSGWFPYRLFARSALLGARGVLLGRAPSPHDRWRQGMGMLSEDRAGEGLALGLSVADNMTLTRLEPFGPAFAVLAGRQDAAAARWIDRLGIRCAHPRQPAGQLSGGNQQKVAVGRLLHHDVDVLVLDEPTRGIDVASKAQIYKLIDELVSAGPGSNNAKAVLLVSSYLPELLGVCDRIAVMSRGRLGPARPVDAWTEHSLLMEASGARAS